jgi:hypothetical protein
VRQFLAAFGGLFPTAAFLLPWVVAAFAASVVVRTSWLSIASALRISVVDAALAYSTLLIVHLVSVPQPDVPTNRVRLVPGTDLGVAVHAAPGDIAPWLQLLGNLLLLFPLGALVPLRVSWFEGFRRVVIMALLVTGVIELTQFALLSGRVVSTDDIVLNTAGALVGSMFSRKWWDDFRRLARRAGVTDPPAEPAGRHRLRPQYARSSSG